MERLIGIPLETALERDAGAGGPAEHLGRGPQRHQVPVRLRHRLLGGPPGGDQPDRHRSATCRRGSSRASRPGARPARSSATCSKGRATRLNQLKAVQDWVLNRALKTVPGRHRRDGLRRDGQAVSGPDRHPAACGNTTSRSSRSRTRSRQLERERRRRHPHPGEPVAQRPRGGSSGRGDRPARPGQRRPVVRDRGRQARGHQQDHRHLDQRQPDLPPQRRPGGRRRTGPGSGSSAAATRGRRRRGDRPDAEVREVAARSPRRSPRRWRRSSRRASSPRGCT